MTIVAADCQLGKTCSGLIDNDLAQDSIQMRPYRSDEIGPDALINTKALNADVHSAGNSVITEAKVQNVDLKIVIFFQK